jgi:hypothetical protein
LISSGELRRSLTVGFSDIWGGVELMMSSMYRDFGESEGPMSAVPDDGAAEEPKSGTEVCNVKKVDS